jgi:hypothetical protein
MTKYFSSLNQLVLLSGLAYLGFYVYGLLMSVFTPGEVVGFTAVAVAVICVTAVHALRMRRAAEDRETRSEELRELHRLRERRGF